MEHVLGFLGCFFLWLAIDRGRDESSRIEIFSRDWWVCVLFLIIAMSLIKLSVKLDLA